MCTYIKDETVNNFWQSVLAEFVVASSLDMIKSGCETLTAPCMPFDLLYNNKYGLSVKTAAYIQSSSAEHPDHISFDIFQEQTQNETGYNCNVYIFCIYTAMSLNENPLDMNLWDFYVLPAKTIDSEKQRQKIITLPSLLTLNPIKCTYLELRETVDKILAV